MQILPKNTSLRIFAERLNFGVQFHTQFMRQYFSQIWHPYNAYEDYNVQGCAGPAGTGGYRPADYKYRRRDRKALYWLSGLSLHWDFRG